MSDVFNCPPLCGKCNTIHSVDEKCDFGILDSITYWESRIMSEFVEVLRRSVNVCRDRGFRFTVADREELREGVISESKEIIEARERLYFDNERDSAEFAGLHDEVAPGVTLLNCFEMEICDIILRLGGLLYSHHTNKESERGNDVLMKPIKEFIAHLTVQDTVEAICVTVPMSVEKIVTFSEVKNRPNMVFEIQKLFAVLIHYLEGVMNVPTLERNTNYSKVCELLNVKIAYNSFRTDKAEWRKNVK